MLVRLGRAAWLRATDLALLAPAPRILGAYLSIWAREYISSPYARRASFATSLAVQAGGHDQSELVYGETPMLTALALLRAAGLGAGGRLLDLGAGRGRVLLAARRMGAEAAGIDIAEQHVSAAAVVLARAGAAIAEGDAADFSPPQPPPTHVFVAWTGFSRTTRARIEERLAALPLGTKVVTVTWPIEHAAFRLASRRRAIFTWGFDDAFVFEL